MAQYEGFVASKKEEGLVKVMIRSSSEGIPGVSERVNQQVCHCAAEGSQVTIDALNEAGAGVGDWVVVRRDTSVLLRNALILIGIPVVGILFGVIISYYMTSGFRTLSLSRILFGVALAAMAIMTAWFTYRRTYKPAVPVIERILMKASAFTPQTCLDNRATDSCVSCRFTC